MNPPPSLTQTEAPGAVLRSLHRSAADRPDAPALIGHATDGSERTITYAELAERSAALALTLRTTAGPGGVLLLCAPNSVEFILWFTAALAAGVLVLPVPPSLTPAELTTIARQSRAAAAVGTPAALHALAHLGLPSFPLDYTLTATPPPASDPDPSTGGVLLQTSGTTGLPKLALRPAAALDAVARQVVDAAVLGPHDHILAAIPLCHSYGVENGILAPLLAGAAIHIRERFDPAETARMIARGQITVFPAVPFMLDALSRERADGPLRLLYSAGSPLPARVETALRERWGRGVGRLYGSTEVGSVTFQDPDDTDAEESAVGHPMSGVSIRLLDPADPDNRRSAPAGSEGHVAIRAPSMLARYLNDEPLPAVDGHFLTGDLGRLDDAGRLVLTGRLKLMIDVGGLKVNPLEVEAALRECPGVAECVVLPLPLSDTVNRLRALIVPRPIGPTPSPADLRAFARERLAPHKVPRIFELRANLPRSATGKILRSALEGGA